MLLSFLGELLLQIDNILLLRTVFLCLPFALVLAYFHYKVKDSFFLKPRSYIQLNIIMICLVVTFVLVVYWHLGLRQYSFLGFALRKGGSGSENIILLLLGSLTAVLGWLFTSRGQSLTSTRSHSIQTLMASRLSDAYTKQVEIATIVFCDLKDKHGDAYNLTVADYKGLTREQVSAINYLLNYLEFIAVGIRYGDLDEKLMKSTLRTIIRKNFKFFEEVIKDKQIAAPTLYEHLAALYKRWS